MVVGDEDEIMAGGGKIMAGGGKIMAGRGCVRWTYTWSSMVVGGDEKIVAGRRWSWVVIIVMVAQFSNARPLQK